MSKKKNGKLAFDYADGLAREDQEAQLANLMKFVEAAQSGDVTDEDIPTPMSSEDRTFSAINSALNDGIRMLNSGAQGMRAAVQNLPGISPISVRSIDDDEDTGDEVSGNDGYVAPLKMTASMMPSIIPPYTQVGQLPGKAPDTPQDTISEKRETEENAVVAPPTVEAYQEDGSDNETDSDYTLSDFPILFVNSDDNIITVHHPRTSNEGVSMHIFGLREYEVEMDSNYIALKSELPWLLAMLAGPLIIVDEKSEPFIDFMKAVLEEGRLDSTKFRIFREKCEVAKYNDQEMMVYVVYSIDEVSYQNIIGSIIPAMEADNSAIDFIVQVCDLVTNGFLNPMAMEVDSWVKDYIGQYVTDDDTIAVCCDMMMRENGFFPGSAAVDQNKAVQAFNEHFSEYIIPYVKSIREIAAKLREKMVPEAYRESFLEEAPDKAADIAEYDDAEKVEAMIEEQPSGVAEESAESTGPAENADNIAVVTAEVATTEITVAAGQGRTPSNEFTITTR